MRIRALGRSGLFVSELALGAMTFASPDWGCDEDTARKLVDRYLDAGGNFIDTADVYGSPPGASEEICGRALRGQRDRVVISTKVGLPTGPGPHDRGAGRTHVIAACEASLRRLGTDFIDLYQIHVDDPPTPLEETLRALDDLVRAGKVRYVGASNYFAYRLVEALAISDRHGLARFVSLQGQYSLVIRTLEREHFPLLAEEGLGFISWSPLAAGMLSGKLARDGAPVDTRLAKRNTGLEALQKTDHAFDVVDVLKQCAAELGCSPAQLALAWQRTRPVTSVIIGVRSTTQLEDDLASLDVDIPPEVLARLGRVSALPEEYPWAFVDIIGGWLRHGGSLVRVL
jgi:aryl-alcohol dehydrogenase-like predicted oxidoreductase